MTGILIRSADPHDAEALLRLIDIASNGFVWHLFAQSAPPGQNVEEFILSRMNSADSGLSFDKTTVAELDGVVAGYIAIDHVPEDPGPVADNEPSLFRPLTELEHEAPGTCLINLLASFPEFRGHGVGSALLREAERSRGPNGMCLTVANDNSGAIGLYERFGYRVAGKRKMVKNGWKSAGSEWLLMVKP